MMAYRSYDDQSVFNLMGGLAIPDRTMPESVQIIDLKGLISPWQNIKQKGATQDGSTYVTSLYDEIEVDMTVSVRGRNPSMARKVLRDWIAAWDAKQPGELSFTTQQGGRWWAPIRWSKHPVDKITGGNWIRQQFLWTGIAYNGFWKTYDCVDVITADGFASLVNPGDQGMFPRLTCFGPGSFTFWDGPGSTDTVTFGPLLANQIVQIYTDPRNRSVVDLTVAASTPQDKTKFQKALAEFEAFAFANNTSPLLKRIQSLFGQTPPQGNLYSLLSGRFSDNSAIPAKPTGKGAPPYSVRMAIAGGSSASAIVVAGTPQRRFPY
jgi:hypothetical protein